MADGELVRGGAVDQRLIPTLPAPPCEEPMCPHCGGPCTHEVLAVGFATEWQPICADYAQECEDNQREVYEHEMSHFGGAYGLPDVRVRPRVARHDDGCQCPECVDQDEVSDAERADFDAEEHGRVCSEAARWL